MLAEMPLETVEKIRDENVDGMLLLTAGLGGGLEGLEDLRVHLDVQVLLDGDLLIPLLDPVLHPAGEHALQHRGADVANPILGDLADLLRVGEVVVDIMVVVLEEGGDIINGQALVLRDRDVPDVLGEDAYRRSWS